MGQNLEEHEAMDGLQCYTLLKNLAIHSLIVNYFLPKQKLTPNRSHTFTMCESDSIRQADFLYTAQRAV